MSNNKQIQPINIWSEEGNKQASVFALTNFFDYHFDDGNGKVTYKLIGFENEVAVEYYTGEVEIPSSIIQQWASSDDLIFSYVANFLNLHII
jgi:hypothetical protein